MKAKHKYEAGEQLISSRRKIEEKNSQEEGINRKQRKQKNAIIITKPYMQNNKKDKMRRQ